MKRSIYGFMLFVSIFVFGFTACEVGKTGADQIYFIFESYYVPSEILLSVHHENYFIKLTGKEYFSEEKNGEIFRAYASQYGEYGRKRFWHIGPPYPKPVSIIGINVYQGEGSTAKDVSQYFTIYYTDYSPFITSGYSINCPPYGDFNTQRKLTELSEHDLKWISENFKLEPEPNLDATTEYTLKIALEGGKECKVTLPKRN